MIQDFVQLGAPVAAVEAIVRREGYALLSATAEAAYREAEKFALGLLPKPECRSSCRTFAVDFGAPWTRDDGMVLPVHWWVTGATRLFPRLDADLEFMPVGDTTTQITLMGRYEPPPSAEGQGLQRGLHHRVAEVSVRSFLTRLADAISDAAAVPALVPVRTRPRSERRSS